MRTVIGGTLLGFVYVRISVLWTRHLRGEMAVRSLAGSEDRADWVAAVLGLFWPLAIPLEALRLQAFRARGRKPR